MSEKNQHLNKLLSSKLGAKIQTSKVHLDEVTIEVAADDLLQVAEVLRHDDELHFETIIDVCGVDYVDYGKSEWATDESSVVGYSRGVEGDSTGRLRFGETLQESDHSRPRFASVYHLLSYKHNWRMRMRVYAGDDEVPIVPSVVGIWPAANWFEREAFDLYGIIYEGHPDLRRLLTDYGFVGHPFRKDFPLIGNVEMRYDPEKQRVVYEPVTIEPRVLVPRVIRDDNRYLVGAEKE